MFSGEYLLLLATLAWLLAALVAGLVAGMAGAAGGRASHGWLTLFAAGQTAIFALQGLDWANNAPSGHALLAFIQAGAVWVLLEAGRRIWNQRAIRRWPAESMLAPAVSVALLVPISDIAELFVPGIVFANSCASLVFAVVAIWPAHHHAASPAERFERLMLALGTLVFGATAYASWVTYEPGLANPFEGGRVVAAALWIAGGVAAGIIGTRVRPRLALALSVATLTVAFAGGWLADRIAGEVANLQRETWQRRARVVATKLRNLGFERRISLRPSEETPESSVLAATLAEEPEVRGVAIWQFGDNRIVPLLWRVREGQAIPGDKSFRTVTATQFKETAPFFVGPPGREPWRQPMVLYPMGTNYWLGLEFAPETWAVTLARARFVSLGVLAAAIMLLAGGGLLLWREAIEQARVVELARQQAAEKARTEFLTFISHELRTPLQTILGRAELLAGEPMAAHHAAAIEKQSQLLLRLVNDLLDLGTIEAGHFALHQQPFSLRAAIGAADDTARSPAVAKKLAFHVEVPASVPDLLVGDEARLRQILGNLLRNAVKYTAQGEVRLIVAAEADAAETARLVFRILDTGPGLPPEKISQLFTLFTRLDAGDSFVREGTGVGLALVRRLCEHMGGSVVAANRPSGGAEFTVRLTLPKAPASALSSTTPPIAIPPGPAGPALVILVAEDNTAARELLAEALRRFGHEVETAADGAAALAMCARRAFDAVVIDVNLPKVDGIALARQLRAQPNPPRLIGCSAEALASTRKAALAAGMDVFLEKPVRLAELAAALPTQRKAGASIFDFLNSPDAVMRAAEIFARERGDLLATIERAVTQRDEATLRQKAHYLHSTALLLQRADLAELCERLGQQARAGDFDGARETVGKILRLAA